MRILCVHIVCMLLFISCQASARSAKSSYVLADGQQEEAQNADVPAVPLTQKKGAGSFMLVGAESGLYKISALKTVIPVWTGGKVSKIVRVAENKGERWFFMTSRGILTSTDLTTFDFRNEGLPFLTIKEYDGTNTRFRKQIHQLKDLSVHPTNPSIMVTATKDNVYITYDGGARWRSIGSMSSSTAGLRAVAVADMAVPGTGKAAVVGADGTVTPAVPPQTELAVFMSHPIFGFSYYLPGRAKPQWNDVSRGFKVMPTQTYPDEIADLLPVVFTGADGFPVTELFVSQSYLPNLYRFNWGEKKAELLYSGTEPVDTIDGLFWDGGQILYTRPGEVAAFVPTKGDARTGTVPAAYKNWAPYFGLLAPNDTLYAAWIPNGNGSSGIALSELWMLRPELCTSKYAEKALDRKAVYCPANHVTTDAGIARYKKLLLDNKLNALVIDMKDDYGLLRYNAKDPLVLEKGFISRYSIDLEHFVEEFKKDDIYLVARIVVFKDKHLSQYDKSKYAIWNSATNGAWVGTRGYESIKNEAGEVTGQKVLYYDENWVDPYCPEVWEYDVRIAQELIRRGFDEIQFDYIRFPTDGKNLGSAQYRWRSEGMDKESALVSFLSYARKNIDAPIGIDIYGANGWYRSGTRTGQDVELLAEYVDIICPMFYPSHFEQSFLNYKPYAERPYRIYFYGTYRNTVIGRNRIIVRPWAQAFYLGVSYDRQYYNSNYVQQQIFGVRDSVDRGYMYWNNSGRYDDIMPDVGNAVYAGTTTEASPQFRKPALSRGRQVEPIVSFERNETIAAGRNDVSLLNSVRVQERQRHPATGGIRTVRQSSGENGA